MMSVVFSCIYINVEGIYNRKKKERETETERRIRLEREDDNKMEREEKKDDINSLTRE